MRLDSWSAESRTASGEVCCVHNDITEGYTAIVRFLTKQPWRKGALYSGQRLWGKHPIALIRFLEVSSCDLRVIPMAETQTEQERPVESPPQPERNGAIPVKDKENEPAPEKNGQRKDNKEADDKSNDREKKPKEPFKWTPLKIWSLVIIGIILIVLGTIYYINASNHATTDDAYTTGHLHYISSRVTGTVIGVLVDDNQSVKQGQVLVQLDPRDYQVKVDQARANYLKTKANDDRIRTVKGDGAISKQDYDLSAAALLVDSATLEDALDQLSYCTICAPSDGYVGNKAVEIGNRVEVGGALLDIVQDDWVLGNYKETQIGHMIPGQRAVINVDAIPDHTFYGWIDSFSPGSGTTFALLPSDNATGNFTKIVQRVPVKIVFDRESTRGYESRLVPGLSVEISVDLKSVPKGQGLPQNQQIHDDQQSHLQTDAAQP
jgi:membrane fusion protein (multidrug efflux system)